MQTWSLRINALPASVYGHSTGKPGRTGTARSQKIQEIFKDSGIDGDGIYDILD
jgi:hypothetical protein